MEKLIYRQILFSRLCGLRLLSCILIYIFHQILIAQTVDLTSMGRSCDCDTCDCGFTILIVATMASVWYLISSHYDSQVTIISWLHCEMKTTISVSFAPHHKNVKVTYFPPQVTEMQKVTAAFGNSTFTIWSRCNQNFLTLPDKTDF